MPYAASQTHLTSLTSVLGGFCVSESESCVRSMLMTMAADGALDGEAGR